MKLKKQAWEQAGTKGHEEARSVTKITLKDRSASEASVEMLEPHCRQWCLHSGRRGLRTQSEP